MRLNKLKVDLKKILYPDLPDAETSQGWNAWNKKAQEKKIRWFFADTLPMKISTSIIWPFERAKNWVRYRTTTKYHVLNLDHEPGYLEPACRILYSNFTILRKFVEGEKAWMQHICDNSEEGTEFMDSVYSARKNKKIWKNADKRSYAMKYLDWEISLEDGIEPGVKTEKKKKQDNSQSFVASEVKEIYIWWMDVRPNRVEPYENEYYVRYHEMRTERGADECELFGGETDTPEESKILTKAMKTSQKLSTRYAKEDEKMLIRLIKIREGLWT